MSKIKMRCNTCGKWFQSANAKEVTCPDCLQKARKEKQAAKNAPSANPAGTGTPAVSTNQVRPAPPPKPKPAASGGNPNRWFDTINDIKVGQPDQPTRPKIPSFPEPRPNRGGPEREGEPDERESSSPGSYREREGQPGNYRDREGQSGYYRDREGQTGRGPGGYRDRGPNYRENERGERNYRGPGAYSAGSLSGTIGQRPRQPSEGGYRPRPGMGGRPGGPGGPGGAGRPGRPGGAATGEKPFRPNKQKVAKPKTPPQPRPKKEKQPPPAPFVPTPEQIAQVEARYLELAVPTEYDGIRTQISKELNIPKKAVKKIIKDLRDREEIPSWWDLQTYKGPSEELEKIRELYVPYLPLPPVGVHRTIAEKLELKPVTVYQAIKVIRQEMGLPQYNDPALHGIELKPRSKKTQAEAPEAEETSEAVKTTGTVEAQEGTPAASATTETEAATAPVAEAVEMTTTVSTAETETANPQPESKAANAPVEQEQEATTSSTEETAPTATDEQTTEPIPVVTEISSEAETTDETAEAVPAAVDGNADQQQQ